MFDVGSLNLTAPGTEQTLSKYVLRERTVLVDLLVCYPLLKKFPDSACLCLIYASVYPGKILLVQFLDEFKTLVTSQTSSFRRDRRILLDA